MYAQVVIKTVNILISRCCFAEDGTDLFISACHADSTLISLTRPIKFFYLWRCRCRCRRRCKSSLMGSRKRQAFFLLDKSQKQSKANKVQHNSKRLSTWKKRCPWPGENGKEQQNEWESSTFPTLLSREASRLPDSILSMSLSFFNESTCLSEACNEHFKSSTSLRSTKQQRNQANFTIATGQQRSWSSLNSAKLTQISHGSDYLIKLWTVTYFWFTQMRQMNTLNALVSSTILPWRNFHLAPTGKMRK